MTIASDPASLSVGELVALVNELKQLLAEKEREIERLKRLVPTGSDQAEPGEIASGSSVEPSPGSVEDLVEELERTSPLLKTDY
ncbi:MAG: hypothetical protein AB7P69_26320 [Candidatus Binatia bacterium]